MNASLYKKIVKSSIQQMAASTEKDYVNLTERERVGKWAPHAVRLRQLRRAIFSESSSQFARRLEQSVQRINNMENGFPLSIEVANLIRLAVPGITMDWLYHGEERGVPMEVITLLRKEAAKPEYRPPS